MKKITSIIFGILSVSLLSAQENTADRSDYINSGFYLKAGPVFPIGQFAKEQTIPFPKPPVTELTYLPARIGAALDMGFLIYLGPSFANNYLRAGIDATFLSAWFNSTRPTNDDNLIENYYTFIGQKFGPVITVNPIDRLMIDISYKLNANFAYHEEYDEWDPLSDGATSEYGYNLAGSEFSLGLRYRVMLFSFQYNFANMNYNNADKENMDQKIKINTFRILIGFKF